MFYPRNRTDLYIEVWELLMRTVEESTIHNTVSSLATSIRPNPLKPDRPKINCYIRLQREENISEEMLLKMKEELEKYQE